MTPSEKWMLGLFAVYGIPSFFCGVGATLLVLRGRDRFLRFPFKSNAANPASRSERRDRVSPGFAPRNESAPQLGS